MEAPQKIVFPEEVHPVINSNPAIAGLETKRGTRRARRARAPSRQASAGAAGYPPELL
jgi:hypothetical protein